MEKYKIKCNEGYVKAVLFSTDGINIPIIASNKEEAAIYEEDKAKVYLEDIKTLYSDSYIKFELEEVK